MQNKSSAKIVLEG